MADRIQLRRANAAAWTSANTILSAGEVGIELDTGKLKVGNGTSAWNEIDYVGENTVSVVGAQGVNVSGNTVSVDESYFDVDAGGTGWQGNIIPSANDVYTLGSPTRVWRDLYVGPGSIYVNGQKVIEDNSGTINITADPDQNLSVGTLGTGDLEFNAGGIIQLKQNVQMSAGTSLSMAGTDPLVFGSDVDMNNHQFTNVAAPTAAGHIVTRDYLETNAVMLNSNQAVAGDKTFSDNVIITGNLTVNGTQTILNTTTLEVEDDFIGLLSGQTGTPALNAGLQVNRGSLADVQLRWNETTDRWQFTNDASTFHDLPTTAEQSNWNTAYSWGDHASAGYLTSFTETDPTVPAHVKSITTTEKSNWNTAYSWGDHASAGYAPASTTLTTGTNQTVTGRKVFAANSPGNIATATSNLGAVEILSNGTGTDAMMTFHVGSDFACYFGLDGGINDLAVGGWSFGANSYRILHLGNYTSFVPSTTGTGASGTWGINVTGNAGTATTATNCSRSITAGTGLTGGGALTANQTISLAADQRLGAGLLTYHGGADTYLLCQDGATAYHRFFTNGTEEMRLTSNGTLDVDGDVVAFSTTISSDARLKQDVVTLTGALEMVGNLRGVRYTWNDKTRREGQQDVGLIAQEVQQVLPELVKEANTLNTEDETHLTVDYGKMVAVLIEAVKDLTAQNAALTQRIEDLENK